MTFREYQKKALQTATYDSNKKGIICCALGLMGEFCEFKENPVPHELGDVWWYFAVLSYYLDIKPKLLRYKKVSVPSHIGRIQEIIKKNYRDNDLEEIGAEHQHILNNIFDTLFTGLYYWPVAFISNTKIECCAEVIWELNITKLQDRKDRGVLHGSGDNR